MSILINGMEMPKSGDLTIVITSSGYVEDLSGNVIKGVEAIPVPPHGKLADVDALIKELTLDDKDDNSGATLLMAIFLEVLKAAPTIIPAEEGE